ncbi:MAG: hypothetical protein ACOX1I_07770 [Dethiobacteria bacterium]
MDFSLFKVCIGMGDQSFELFHQVMMLLEQFWLIACLLTNIPETSDESPAIQIEPEDEKP